MDWFKHDVGSRNGEKISLIRKKFGLSGVGAYWILCEMVAEKCADDGCQLASFPIANYSEQLGANYYQARKFVDFFCKIGAFDLVVFNGKIICELDKSLFQCEKPIANHSEHDLANHSEHDVKIDSQRDVKNHSQIGPGPYIARACAPVKNQKPNKQKPDTKNQIPPIYAPYRSHRCPPQNLELFEAEEIGPKIFDADWSEVDPPKKTRRVRTRLAADWWPDQKMIDFATEAWGLSLDQVHGLAVEFRDYWLSRTGKDAEKLDWARTWKNFLSMKFSGGIRRNGQSTRAPYRRESNAANFIRALRESARG